MIYLHDTIRTQLEVLLKKQDSQLEARFYESLRQHEDSSSLGERIINALTNLEAGSNAAPDVTFQKNFSEAEGKIIRDIRIRVLEVIGYSLNDTADDVTSGIAGFANRKHMHTREKVLRNRLLLKPGDIIRPDVILDNERIIRTLPYIRDARLIIKPVKGDTVDLLLISQDLLAYTAAFRPLGFDAGKLNLGNSQGEAALRYENTEYVQAYGAGLERNFITPDIMLAGGIDFF